MSLIVKHDGYKVMVDGDGKRLIFDKDGNRVFGGPHGVVQQFAEAKGQSFVLAYEYPAALTTNVRIYDEFGKQVFGDGSFIKVDDIRTVNDEIVAIGKKGNRKHEETSIGIYDLDGRLLYGRLHYSIAKWMRIRDHDYLCAYPNEHDPIPNLYSMSGSCYHSMEEAHLYDCFADILAPLGLMPKLGSLYDLLMNVSGSVDERFSVIESLEHALIGIYSRTEPERRQQVMSKNMDYLMAAMAESRMRLEDILRQAA